MKLCLKKIGKIGTASIEINGITVIAGENDTGKSTVGRGLFAVFNSFYDTKDRFRSQRITSVRKRIVNMCASLDEETYLLGAEDEVVEGFINDIEKYKNNPDNIKAAILDFLQKRDIEFHDTSDNDSAVLTGTIRQITEALNVSDTELLKLMLEENLTAEFCGQINNIVTRDAGEIHLSLKNQQITMFIKNDHVVDVECSGSMDLHTEAVYLDDPFVLDKGGMEIFHSESDRNHHRNHLKQKLFSKNPKSNLVDEIVATNQLEQIYETISSVCSGAFVPDNRYGLGYKTANSGKILNVKNLSTGLKTFAILKILLTKGLVEYNGTMILDEPEINLHPEWQVVLAELIVLIQKEFNMHILLNTHSPYFLNAIEVYAAKHGIDHKCRYYLSSVKGEYTEIKDVTDRIEEIYKKLARPLQELENERNRYD